MGIKIVVQQWMGHVWIEVHQVDHVGAQHLVARRRVEWLEDITPPAAFRLLRDELPFLEALAETEAFQS